VPLGYSLTLRIAEPDPLFVMIRTSVKPCRTS
jgi:hypothetical protein